MVGRAILVALATLALNGCTAAQTDKGMRSAGITSVSVRHVKGPGSGTEDAQTTGAVVTIKTTDCTLRRDDARAVFDTLSAAEPVFAAPGALHPPERRASVVIVFRGPGGMFAAAVPTFVRSGTNGSIILFNGTPRRLAPDGTGAVLAAMKRSGCSASARWE